MTDYWNMLHLHTTVKMQIEEQFWSIYFV